LRSHIKGTGLPCETFTETFWLKQRFLKLAVFPDIMVRCGRMEPGSISVDDPLILIEVVSPSSESRDRSEKASAYMRLASLKHVCFVDRDRVRLDIFDQTEGGWVPRQPIESIEDVFPLAAIGFSMPVAEVYDGVLQQGVI
jgi:Uma2 family endonuclease